nr:1,3-beta-glucanosyltransferase pga4 [Quercus suber]
MAAFFKTADLMARYPNTLGLLIGDEVINDVPSRAAMPFLRAAVRDLKTYMKHTNDLKGQRVLPVGYTAAQNDRSSVFDLSLGDPSSAIDFWTARMTRSLLDLADVDLLSVQRILMDITDVHQLDRVATAAIPMLLSEYGASIAEPPDYEYFKPRLFQETKALYSAPMTRTFSGGCVYEFWRAANGYGLVEMLPSKMNTRSAAYRAAMARAKDQNLVLEKRETEEGTLLVYHDFANYKARLEATEDVESTWAQGHPNAGVESQDIGVTQTSRLQSPQLDVPDTCVDWDRIQQDINSPA